MRLGIVGAEARKFTLQTRDRARAEIRRLIVEYKADVVVSGASPLGGIDKWAVAEARKLGIDVQEYPPATNRWHDGYKLRNLQIAEGSDVVVCIAVKDLPPSYTGRRFEGGCYHCHTADHVKSGGCWTAKQANRLGKPTELVIV